MKYTFFFSLLSLVTWKYDYIFSAGLFGLFAGLLFILLLHKKIQLLAIGCISASMISVMLFPIEFSFSMVAHIGIAWAVTITTLTIFFIFIGFLLKTKEKLQ